MSKLISYPSLPVDLYSNRHQRYTSLKALLNGTNAQGFEDMLPTRTVGLALAPESYDLYSRGSHTGDELVIKTASFISNTFES